MIGLIFAVRTRPRGACAERVTVREFRMRAHGMRPSGQVYVITAQDVRIANIYGPSWRLL